MGLIKLGMDEKIPIDEFKDAEKEIIYSIEWLQYKINSIKSSTAWRWGTGDNITKENITRQITGGPSFVSIIS